MAKWTLVVVVTALLSWAVLAPAADQQWTPPPVGEGDRCPVCGMLVVKHRNWLAQIRLTDGRVLAFDGPKDMLVYFFAPQLYGAPVGVGVEEIRVTDYYDQKWLDGRKAWYVIGSDVIGPMGHELIPLGSEAAAETFRKDHQGEKILPFAAITAELVEGLRHGHGMKGHAGRQ